MLDLTCFSADLVLSPDERDDDVPEPPKEPVSKLGDIYQLGRHRVACGDSTKLEDVERLMNGQKADLVFTDPPYGIGYEYNKHKDQNGAEYLNFCETWFKILQEKADLIIITTGWAYKQFWYSKLPYDEMQWIMKGKHSGGKASNFRLAEPIFVFGKIRHKYDFDVFETTNKLQYAGEVNLRDLHSCPKPVDLICELVVKQIDLGEMVLDVFLGSGTTLIAAEKTNRICYGMEIDPRYVDVAVERWQNYTGLKAIKL